MVYTIKVTYGGSIDDTNYSNIFAGYA